MNLVPIYMYVYVCVGIQLKTVRHKLFSIEYGGRHLRGKKSTWPPNGPVWSFVHQPQQPKDLLILVHVVSNLRSLRVCLLRVAWWLLYSSVFISYAY